MEKNVVAAGVIGFVLGIIISPLVFRGFGVEYVTTGGYRMGNQGPMMGGGSREQLGGNRFGMSSNIDAHFIEQMIPHHEDAVRMAEFALVRAEHQEIKNLARAIQSAQNREIGEMKTWYRNWFGGEVPPVSGLGFGMHGMMGGGMGMMGNVADLGELERASEFDREFIEQMIPHHQMAVMMAQMLLGTTARGEMQKLAQDIISSQSAEISQMRAWYDQWYGKN